MRRLIAAVMLLGFVTFSSACHRRKKATAREDGLASVINVADPADSAQLIRGFSNVEADAWRWAAGKFAVVLRPPTGAAQNGAKLELKFTLHPTVVSKLGPVTVSAKVNGVAVDPETFSQPGDYTYSHDVPASALGADVVTVEFATDKSLAPSDNDRRELALIVKTMGLVSK